MGKKSFLFLVAVLFISFRVSIAKAEIPGVGGASQIPRPTYDLDDIINPKKPARVQLPRNLPVGSASVAVTSSLFLAILVYYLLVWQKVGKDPASGPLLIERESPDDLSPAALRYVTKTEFDDTALSASLLSLAVKGFTSIEKEGGEYVVRDKGKDIDSLPDDERMVLRTLRKEGEIFALSSKTKTLQDLRADLSEYFEKKFEKYFSSNSLYFRLGAYLSAIAVAVALYFLPHFNIYASVGAIFWISGWTAGLAHMAEEVCDAWRTNKFKWTVTLFSIPFFAAWLIGPYLLASQGSIALSVAFMSFLLINVLFYYLLKSRTPEGQKLLDRANGFRAFLSSPGASVDISPKTFEKFLPHAFALGVSDKWAKHFAASFGGKREIRFPWYTGSDYADSIHFSSELNNAFYTAVSSALNPPEPETDRPGYYREE